MIKLLRRAWSLVVVVLEGKMHWAVGRIGWRGRRERWRSVVVVVVYFYYVVVVYFHYVFIVFVVFVVLVFFKVLVIF